MRDPPQPSDHSNQNAIAGRKITNGSGSSSQMCVNHRPAHVTGRGEDRRWVRPLPRPGSCQEKMSSHISCDLQRAIRRTIARMPPDSFRTSVTSFTLLWHSPFVEREFDMTIWFPARSEPEKQEGKVDWHFPVYESMITLRTLGIKRTM